jgi:peptidoglycan/xylan/chitin deacetylase (PgdA/CDA1 family)
MIYVRSTKKLIRLIPLFFSSLFLIISSCQNKPSSKVTVASATTIVGNKEKDPSVEETTKNEPVKIADAATILARKQVPVLCYHQIRNWKASDSKVAKDYIVPIEDFRQQIKMLADSGYHTILPDQLFAYLNTGAPLPSKPIMLTFDDTDLDQYTVAAPEMKKYGFKGVFFVMTVSIGRPNYMNKEQIKSLSDEGHIIGSHTWDHHNFKKYEGEDWVTQIEKPTKKIQEITGKPVKYFAYPFGLWNAKGIPELKSRGFEAAFQLADKRDEQDPLFTIRRIIASGYWSPRTLHNSIVKSF